MQGRLAQAELVQLLPGTVLLSLPVEIAHQGGQGGNF